MRFLSTLLLSLCCLAASLQSNAADIPVKQSKQVSTEYRIAEQAFTTDALNDYHQVTATVHIVTNHLLAKKNSSFFTCTAAKNIPAYILNTSFKNSRIVSSGNYAKTFKIKLIFPQHYHW